MKKCASTAINEKSLVVSKDDIGEDHHLYKRSFYARRLKIEPEIAK